MCNDYRLLIDVATIIEDFADIKIRIDFPEGIPNLEPRADIRITDTAPIVRVGDQTSPELVQRRWSWPGPTGKPLYVMRSDGRDFRSGRCLIIADGFYEFTTPADPEKKRKDKWLFTRTDEPWFCIAGLWQANDRVGEAFTMLTTGPGPDIAPYHPRQVAVLDRADCGAWLDPAVPARSLIKPLPQGSLTVEQVG
jgi:putative SOS response-associated peptidase YedK